MERVSFLKLLNEKEVKESKKQKWERFFEQREKDAPGQIAHFFLDSEDIESNVEAVIGIRTPSLRPTNVPSLDPFDDFPPFLHFETFWGDLIKLSSGAPYITRVQRDCICDWINWGYNRGNVVSGSDFLFWSEKLSKDVTDYINLVDRQKLLLVLAPVAQLVKHNQNLCAFLFDKNRCDGTLEPEFERFLLNEGVSKRFDSKTCKFYLTVHHENVDGFTEKLREWADGHRVSMSLFVIGKIEPSNGITKYL